MGIRSTLRRGVSWLPVAIPLIASSVEGSAVAENAPANELAATPVVLFPAFHFTRLLVTVSGQTSALGCPSSGAFEEGYMTDAPIDFSQSCQDKLLTLHYHHDSVVPMERRFASQPGVVVTVIDYGKTSSAPFYEPLYSFLEAHGYTRDRNIRVAGYDSRLTPDLDGFLERTTRLIEQTYYENGRIPVHLVGHSNGPFYAQYLLTHTSEAWKRKFVHGFSPWAASLPGQGLSYALFFAGLNVRSFSFPADRENAASSARMHQSCPSTYMMAADPSVFRNEEVVIKDARSGLAYTPRDALRMFKDAGLWLSVELGKHYIGFVDFREPESFPGVDVFAEKGSGIVTPVGVELPDLSVGQVLAQNLFFSRDGDGNQEDITNEAIQVWASMPHHSFELVDRPGVDHFSLPGNAEVLSRLLEVLQRKSALVVRRPSD